MDDALRITEIFYSLQGESTKVGLPSVFIRLTGCPLRCQYCDTAYAFKGGKKISIADIIKKVQTYNTRHVCVTGGEPLAQKMCLVLLTKLCDLGFDVSLETSGAIDVSGVDKRVMKIIDFKTPGSGELSRNLYDNIEHLQATDQVKFVICHREDYDFACALNGKYKLNDRCEVLFSPSKGQIGEEILAGWILHDQQNVRYQVQLHKILWGDCPAK